MEKYKVIFPIPKRTVYFIGADYPEAAKREAARLHKRAFPNLKGNVTELSLAASCFRVNPKSGGMRHKEPSIIEEMYKKYYGEET